MPQFLTAAPALAACSDACNIIQLIRDAKRDCLCLLTLKSENDSSDLEFVAFV